MTTYSHEAGHFYIVAGLDHDRERFTMDTGSLGRALGRLSCSARGSIWKVKFGDPRGMWKLVKRARHTGPLVWTTSDVQAKMEP